MPLDASLIGEGVGILQTGIGAVEKAIANSKLKKLFKQRKAFTTPSEVFDILNATEYQAQTGFNAETLNYLTGKADRGFATSIGTAERLGADPNILSGLNDNYIQDIMKIGSDNAMLQLQNFDKFLGAKQLVATNKEAEFASQQDLIKDQMAMYGQKAAAGATDMSSGLNLLFSSLSASQQSSLYKDYLDKIAKNGGTTAALPPPTSGSGGRTPSQILNPPGI